MVDSSFRPAAVVATGRRLRFLASCLAITAGFALSAVPAWADTQGFRSSGFNAAGNILISDQFNNRVIEVSPKGDIVWSFGIGPTDFSPASIIGVNDAERISGGRTLMAGTGTPPSTVPTCTSSNGCPDNRVLIVDAHGRILWQYGVYGVTGDGFDRLNTPVQATELPDGHVLITDQGNQRVIEVNRRKRILWQYGMTGVSGNGFNQLNSPNSAELLASGNILIADENNNRAIEVNRDLDIVATYTAGGTVGAVAFASRLPDGHTLLTDAGNSRAVEVDQSDKVVWQYVTNTQTGSNPSPLPTRALRLRDGNTIISDQFNQRVIIVSPEGMIVATFGNLDQSGFSLKSTAGGLDGPYDAKVIGDYTGITPPEPSFLTASAVDRDDTGGLDRDEAPAGMITPSMK